MQCGSARHLPSSGATTRRALLGVGRAPAIAFAPRTESREASSVLARRRRVCGRLCYSPGGALAGGPRFPCSCYVRRGACRKAGAPRPSVVSAVPIGPLFSVTAGASASRLLAERPMRLYGEQSSSGVNGTAVRFPRTRLTRNFSQIVCDIDHKPPGRRAPFR